MNLKISTLQGSYELFSAVAYPIKRKVKYISSNHANNLEKQKKMFYKFFKITGGVPGKQRRFSDELERGRRDERDRGQKLGRFDRLLSSMAVKSSAT